MEDEKLAIKIHIRHSTPIDVEDFAKTIKAIGGLYSSFVKDNMYFGTSQKTSPKLYVEKVQEGSIILYLAEMLPMALPFIENANSIIQFGEFICKIVNYYAKGIGEKPNLSGQQIKDSHDLFSITAKDRGSRTDIGVVNNFKGVTFNNCSFEFPSSNLAQNILNDEQSTTKTPTSNIHHQVLLKLFQIQSEDGTAKGNKGIIDSIYPKRLSLTFQSDDLKTQILYSPANHL